MKLFKYLSIREKFVISFIAGGVLIGAIATFFIYIMIVKGLGKIENYYLENELYSVEHAIENELGELSRIARDYAHWDDMYNYAATPNDAWVKLNVTDWIPKNFGVNLILLLDAGNKLIYQYGDFAEFKMDKDLLSHPLIREAVESTEIKGLYSTSKGLAYIASSQIMHTDGSGPRNGTYLYGRLLNNDGLGKIKGLTGMDISIIIKDKIANSTIVGDIDRAKDLNNIYKNLKNKKLQQFSIYKPDYQHAFIYGPLKDPQARDIGMLEIMRSRRTIPLVINFFIQASFWIISFVALAVFILVMAITGLILRPLDAFKKTIEEIQKTKDTLKRVNIESEDEIGILARQFNAMLDALNKSENDLIKTQQDLIKAEKMGVLAELAMGTVHQINNPLSIVVGRVQLLQRLAMYNSPIPIPDLQNDLKVIEEQTKRAVQITNSLLRYATPPTFRFEKCNINELLKETIELIRGQIEGANINIVENLKEDLPLVEYCDPHQMRDVFMNIIMNAKQAMSGGGKLEISTGYDEKEGMVCIKFSDNGCGIAPEHMDKLFTPFFSTRADGSGLGLSMSRNIVEGHHGDIGVESKFGVGSSFTVKLPAMKKPGNTV